MESEDEQEQGPSKPSAPAGRSSARGSKRGPAVEAAIDVDELPERHGFNAEKPHEHADAPGAGPERLPQPAIASGLPGTRSNVASRHASPLAAPLKSPHRAPPRASSPRPGASGARRRMPSERLVNSKQQRAEAEAEKEEAARRRMRDVSPVHKVPHKVPKSQFHLHEGDEKQMTSDGL